MKLRVYHRFYLFLNRLQEAGLSCEYGLQAGVGAVTCPSNIAECL